MIKIVTAIILVLTFSGCHHKDKTETKIKSPDWTAPKSCNAKGCIRK